MVRLVFPWPSALIKSESEVISRRDKRSPLYSTYVLGSLDIDPPNNYWGSKEEHEVEFVLKAIINCCHTKHCDKLLQSSREKLCTTSTGWVDRFVSNQGITVLHKLMQDAHAGENAQGDRELCLVQCMHLIFKRAAIAQQLFLDPLTEDLIKTLQKGLISPVEETRVSASQTILFSKAKAGSQSKVSQLLTLSR